ncbi:hypothetical protein TKK_0012955 [Trichogramma kaykai]
MGPYQVISLDSSSKHIKIRIDNKFMRVLIDQLKPMDFPDHTLAQQAATPVAISDYGIINTYYYIKLWEYFFSKRSRINWRTTGTTLMSEFIKLRIIIGKSLQDLHKVQCETQRKFDTLSWTLTILLLKDRQRHEEPDSSRIPKN